MYSLVLKPHLSAMVFLNARELESALRVVLGLYGTPQWLPEFREYMPAIEFLDRLGKDMGWKIGYDGLDPPPTSLVQAIRNMDANPPGAAHQGSPAIRARPRRRHVEYPSAPSTSSGSD